MEIINTAGYTYDAVGDLTTDGVCSYTWDAEGRQTAVSGTGCSAASYVYDGDGQRVKKSTDPLYWYGLSGASLSETDLGGNNPTEYIFFGGRRLAKANPDGSIYFYFDDQIGSTRTMTDATGNVCYDADFYPFGGERTPYVNSCAQNYKFAGMERDPESVNDHTVFRQYASNYGRWLSADPAGMAAASPANPQSWNRYAYVLNNPTNLTDPLGLDAGSVGCNFGGAEIPNMTNYNFGCAQSSNTGTYPDVAVNNGVNYGIYEASYNGPAPTIAYWQAGPFNQVNSFFGGPSGNMGTRYAAPPASVWNNSNPDPGYHGGQIEADENAWTKYLADSELTPCLSPLCQNAPYNLNRFTKVDVWIFDNSGGTVQSYELKYLAFSWSAQLAAFGLSSPSATSAPSRSETCGKIIGSIMSAWKQQLQAWIAAHPGETPPAAVATPPILNVPCG